MLSVLVAGCGGGAPPASAPAGSVDEYERDLAAAEAQLRAQTAPPPAATPGGNAETAAPDGICDVAGDADPRCTGARGRVRDAGDLLKQSGCTCSS